MSEQFHKDIHKDSFKLRILTTNACNLNCSYCLNDFQPKPKTEDDKLFIDPEFAMMVIEAYRLYCRNNNIFPEFYYSGGESTIHPAYLDLVDIVAKLECEKKFVLCTNGLKFQQSDILHSLGKFTELHISLHRSSTFQDQIEQIARLLPLLDSSSILQQVVFDAVLVDNLGCKFGLTGGEIDQAWNRIQDNLFPGDTKFKVWCDYWKTSDPSYMEYYRWFINEHPWILNRGKDFTPTNRGAFCEGCKKNCVTLKAIWAFPDNTIYPCPQSDPKERWQASTVTELYSLMEEAYQGHKVS